LKPQGLIYPPKKPKSKSKSVRDYPANEEASRRRGSRDPCVCTGVAISWWAVRSSVVFWHVFYTMYYNVCCVGI